MGIFRTNGLRFAANLNVDVVVTSIGRFFWRLFGEIGKYIHAQINFAEEKKDRDPTESRSLWRRKVDSVR